MFSLKGALTKKRVSIFSNIFFIIFRFSHLFFQLNTSFIFLNTKPYFILGNIWKLWKWRKHKKTNGINMVFRKLHLLKNSKKKKAKYRTANKSIAFILCFSYIFPCSKITVFPTNKHKKSDLIGFRIMTCCLTHATVKQYVCIQKQDIRKEMI